MEHRNFTSVKIKQQLLIIFPESPLFSLISLSEFIFPDFQVARHPGGGTSSGYAQENFRRKSAGQNIWKVRGICMTRKCQGKEKYRNMWSKTQSLAGK